MKICAWNVRGCNSPLKLKEVSDFFQGNHIDVLGILEIRIRRKKASKIIRANFRCLSVFYNYDVHTNGRIWIVWNTRTVSVLPLFIHAQFIHCKLTHHDTNISCFSTFVYGSNDPTVRLGLWDALCSLVPSVQDWVVLGDFNVIRDVSERVSSVLPNLDDILAFNSCILSCGLVDLRGTGCEYTWTNNQDGSDRVWSKLDRALVNGGWLDHFPSSNVNFLTSGISDHSPSLVTIFPNQPCLQRFSFLNCWIDIPGYHSLIQEAWDIPIAGSAMYKLLSKLKNTREALCSFHRHNTSGFLTRLARAKATLDDSFLALQSSPMCSSLLLTHK
ncbi:hypothetical protein RND81_13G084700 [Saponaria officinalis]|uniref:Endonuclease/exonuclease/phosphatase domain-containing protein n=1 Tax=Saponaria officinalis TaxID=3572 RepID=A0AAW1GVF0_SAPOF